MSSGLYRFYKKVEKFFNTLLQGEANLLDPTRIHDLHVAIKKLKSFYRFLEHADKEFDYNKNYKIYRPLFQYLGRIRDTQVENELATRLGNLLAVPDMMPEGSVEAYRAGLIAISHSVDEEKMAQLRRRVKRSLKRIDPQEAIPDYLHWQLHRILKKWKQARKDAAALHPLRVLLKDLTYNHPFVRKGYRTKKLAKKIEEGALALEKAIGDWHDLQVYHAFIAQAAARQAFSPQENTIIQSAQVELVRQCDELLSDISKGGKALKRLINKALA